MLVIVPVVTPPSSSEEVTLEAGAPQGSGPGPCPYATCRPLGVITAPSSNCGRVMTLLFSVALIPARRSGRRRPLVHVAEAVEVVSTPLSSIIVVGEQLAAACRSS